MAHIQVSYLLATVLPRHIFAKLLGGDPKSQLDDDLARMKSLLELGKTRAHGEVSGVGRSREGGSNCPNHRS